MGLPELKQKIQMQIENADERLLRIVSSVFDIYLNEDEFIAPSEHNLAEPVVAYDTAGKPLTLKQYNKEIDKALDDFDNGRFISQEDLEKEIDSWYDE